jgi:uncharacterized membrane protein YheB (UPF0754 family)
LGTTFLIPPLVCAFIGWLTNYLAIRMLFHPRKGIRIFGLTFQGILPKRQKELARKLGQLVEEELVNHEDIRRAVSNPQFQDRLRVLIRLYVHRFIHSKLTAIHPMLASLLKGTILDKLVELIVDEVRRFIPDMIEEASEELESRFNFQQLVQDKVESFSTEKIETMFFSLMRKEFWFIELVGGVLGLAVGTAQSALMFLL